MQVVDRITSSGYSYVSPAVDRACTAVPLLGGIKQRIEPYAPPLIHKADMCIDSVYGVVEYRTTALRGAVISAGTKANGLKDAAYVAVGERVTALNDKVTSVGEKTYKTIEESAVVTRVHKTSLAIVDKFDLLIDYYLPEPEAKDGSKKEDATKLTQALIPRMLKMPLKIPVRMMHISISKASDGYDVVQIKIQWAKGLTLDQKAKLQAYIKSQSQAITDKVSSSSVAIKLGQGKQNGLKMLQAALKSMGEAKDAIGVKCYILCDKLRLLEMKDWLLSTVGTLQQATIDRTSQLSVVVSKSAYGATSLIAGKDRATDIFTLVGTRLPFVKVALHASASTGALSDSSSHEAEQKTEPSTGETGETAAVEKVAEKTPIEESADVKEEIGEKATKEMDSEQIDAQADKNPSSRMFGRKKK